MLAAHIAASARHISTGGMAHNVSLRQWREKLNWLSGSAARKSPKNSVACAENSRRQHQNENSFREKAANRNHRV
jgi:hypothetical protein